jgi:hypothetical protein
MPISQHFVIICIVMSVRQCRLASIFYSISFYLKSIDGIFVISFKLSLRILLLWVLTSCRIICSGFLMKVTPASSEWLIKVQIDAEVIRRRGDGFVMLEGWREFGHSILGKELQESVLLIPWPLYPTCALQGSPISLAFFPLSDK